MQSSFAVKVGKVKQCQCVWYVHLVVISSSYRLQNNRHVDHGPINESRRRTVVTAETVAVLCPLQSVRCSWEQSSLGRPGPACIWTRKAEFSTADFVRIMPNNEHIPVLQTTKTKKKKKTKTKRRRLRYDWRPKVDLPPRPKKDSSVGNAVQNPQQHHCHWRN